MTKAYRVEPDLEFLREVRRSGGDTLKKCFQCAACSIMCPISPVKDPFPRKEMIQAQWGLKDKLVKDPDIWLCHNCNDCSTYCPRGARPGDVLKALRQKSIEHYSRPRALAKRIGDRKSLPFLFGIPALVFLIVVMLTNLWWWGDGPVRVVGGVTLSLADAIRPWEMIPMWAVDSIFIVTSLTVLGIFAAGVFRFWRDMNLQRKRQTAIIPSLVEVIRDILSHRDFKECGTKKDRYFGHLGIFYGFVAR